MSEPINLVAQEPKSSLWDRLMWRVFAGYVAWPWPEDENQKHPPNAVLTEVFMVFDWKDRLRILFGGIPCARLLTVTEHDAGATNTNTNVAVLRPKERPCKENLRPC